MKAIKAQVYQFSTKKPLIEKSPIVKIGDPKTSPTTPVTIGNVIIAAYNLRISGGNKEETVTLKQLSDYMWANCIGEWIFSQEDWDKLSPKSQKELKKVT